MDWWWGLHAPVFYMPAPRGTKLIFSRYSKCQSNMELGRATEICSVADISLHFQSLSVGWKSDYFLMNFLLSNYLYKLPKRWCCFNERINNQQCYGVTMFLHHRFWTYYSYPRAVSSYRLPQYRSWRINGMGTGPRWICIESRYVGSSYTRSCLIQYFLQNTVR
jgi:hypothetical protein